MAETNGFIGTVSLETFLLFIFVIIFTFVIGSIFNIIIKRLLKEKVRPVIYKTISKILVYGVYAIGVYYAFGKIIGLNVPASLAALGVLGIAILLPALPVLQNIAAGIVLAFERPFREEDIVEINGTICKVKDVMLRKTRLRSLDGQIITVPNISFMTGTPIVNYSKGEFIKVVLTIDIASGSNKEKAKDIIEKICYESPNILPNIPEKKLNKIMKVLEIPRNFLKIQKNIKDLTTKVMVKNVTKDKITLEIWFWTWDILMKEQIISSFYEKLSKEFKKAGIKFG